MLLTFFFASHILVSQNCVILNILIIMVFHTNHKLTHFHNFFGRN